MPASLPAGGKDKQNMAHLKCRLPQVVVLAVLNEQNFLLFFFFLSKYWSYTCDPKHNTLKIHTYYFWSFVHCCYPFVVATLHLTSQKMVVRVMLMTCSWYPWGLGGVSHFSPEDLPSHNPEANRYLGMNELGCSRAKKICFVVVLFCSVEVGPIVFLFPCATLTFSLSAG